MNITETTPHNWTDDVWYDERATRAATAIVRHYRDSHAWQRAVAWFRARKTRLAHLKCYGTAHPLNRADARWLIDFAAAYEPLSWPRLDASGVELSGAIAGQDTVMAWLSRGFRRPPESGWRSLMTDASSSGDAWWAAFDRAAAATASSCTP